MFPTLIFDIETIPDVAGIRKLNELPDTLTDAEVAQWAFAQQRAKNGSDFLPLYLQRVCAISCVLREGADKLAVWTLGEESDNEATLLQKFFEIVERKTPQLVSWNGGGFDLPVLIQRGLINGVAASRLLETGANDRAFNFDHYLNRYKERHLDLMDFMAMYQMRANAPLDAIAKLCGFAGKLGMDGSKVWDAFQRGEIANIRAYCETDVANTYLVFLRFLMMRGELDTKQYGDETKMLREKLRSLPGAHWKEFLAAWATSPLPMGPARSAQDAASAAVPSEARDGRKPTESARQGG
jgi:3'-5' exonuclease